MFLHNEWVFKGIFIWAETCETIFEIEKTGFVLYSGTGS